MNTQIAEYNETAAAIAVLRQKYADYGSVVIATTKDMALAKEARAEVRGYRVALEKLRVELKAPALERTRLIDAEAKRITAELWAIEEPIDNAIKAEERRKEEEKAAKARAEAERVAAIQRRIAAIRQYASNAAGQRAAIIRAALVEAKAYALIPLEFAEFLPDALTALDETRQQLAAMLATQEQFEEEQARIQAEQVAEQARIQAEREELARLQAKQAAEQARIKAEAEAIARQRAEVAEQQRKVEEARKAEEARQQANVRARKAKADPLADLKRAFRDGTADEGVIDEAYQRGYQDGMNAAQRAA